jgi:hypothetical protein
MIFSPSPGGLAETVAMLFPRMSKESVSFVVLALDGSLATKIPPEGGTTNTTTGVRISATN